MVQGKLETIFGNGCGNDQFKNVSGVGENEKTHGTGVRRLTEASTSISMYWLKLWVWRRRVSEVDEGEEDWWVA
jgi:hypothetical protein